MHVALFFSIASYQQDSGLKLLEIRASDIFKYSLQLMDALLSEEELSSSCYQVAERGTPSDKPPLLPRRVKCMEGGYIYLHQF